MSCATKCKIGTVRTIFLVLNWIVLAISILLVIFNLLISFAAFAENFVNEVAAALGLSSSIITSFLVISTLLVSFFSGVASVGMEAAAYREHWNTPAGKEMFQICCCHIMKTKMAIYCVVTFVFGLGLLVATGLFNTGLVTVDINSLLDGFTLGSCNDVIGSLIIPLQTPNQCCGLDTFNTTNCGSWENNIPRSCGCDPSLNETGCITAADAVSSFSCVINDATVSLIDSDGNQEVGMWTTGCDDVFVAEYFEGFGVIYAFGYGIGGFLLICFGLAVAVSCMGD